MFHRTGELKMGDNTQLFPEFSNLKLLERKTFDYSLVMKLLLFGILRYFSEG